MVHGSSSATDSPSDPAAFDAYYRETHAPLALGAARA